MRTAPRIFDTFPFDAEFDLLEFRLRENFSNIDFFVLVEAAETYRGVPKPFHFRENSARFAWAKDKIRAVQLNTLGPPSATPRQRAAVQRNALLLALGDADPDDVILLLDADEIPSTALLRRLREEGLGGAHRLEMTRHYQKLDLVAPASTCCIDRSLPFPFARGRLQAPAWDNLGGRWSGRSGVAIPAGLLQQRPAFDHRFDPASRPVLSNAGRHLTATDQAARLEQKMGRVFHAEWATSRGMYPPHLRRCAESGIHHRGWWYAETPRGPLPEDLARLAAAHPDMHRARPLPAMFLRRLVRTWAWARQWPRLSERAVRGLDDHFERLLPILALPLLAADGVRALAARLPRRTEATPTPGDHAHH